MIRVHIGSVLGYIHHKFNSQVYIIGIKQQCKSHTHNWDNKLNRRRKGKTFREDAQLTREWKEQPLWGYVTPGHLQEKGGQKVSDEEPANEKHIFPCLQ